MPVRLQSEAQAQAAPEASKTEEHPAPTATQPKIPDPAQRFFDSLAAEAKQRRSSGSIAQTPGEAPPPPTVRPQPRPEMTAPPAPAMPVATAETLAATKPAPATPRTPPPPPRPRTGDLTAAAQDLSFIPTISTGPLTPPSAPIAAPPAAPVQLPAAERVVSMGADLGDEPIDVFGSEPTLPYAAMRATPGADDILDLGLPPIATTLAEGSQPRPSLEAPPVPSRPVDSRPPADELFPGAHATLTMASLAPPVEAPKPPPPPPPPMPSRPRVELPPRLEQRPEATSAASAEPAGGSTISFASPASENRVNHAERVDPSILSRPTAEPEPPRVPYRPRPSRQQPPITLAGPATAADAEVRPAAAPGPDATVAASVAPKVSPFTPPRLTPEPREEAPPPPSSTAWVSPDVDRPTGGRSGLKWILLPIAALLVIGISLAALYYFVLADRFGGASAQTSSTPSTTPATPPASHQPSATPAQPSTTSSQPPATSPSAPASPAPSPTHAPETTAAVPAGAGGFTIQIASAKVEADSQKRADELHAAGADAYVARADLGAKGVWYRVRVGRYDSSAAAHAAAAKLHLKSFIVVPFEGSR